MIWLNRPEGPRLAARHDTGSGNPAVLFVHGLMSDMDGEKAMALASHCAAQGREFLRFDLSGHGRSAGAFRDCTVGGWRDDAALALARMQAPRVVVVGSSLGGWIALLLALAEPERVAGLLLVAPAPDMTRRIAAAMPEAARQALDRDGVWHRPSRYGAPIPITRRMMEDGERHSLLHAPIDVAVPVRILHGQQDGDVPWQGSLALADRLRGDDVQLLLLKRGEHRLSRPDELAVLCRTLDALCEATVAPEPERG